MRINHNIAALNTHRQMGQVANGAAKSMERLSSGLRINKASDDAAGLAISEKMRGQIRGLDMASKNAQDGVSLIATAEGALNETHSILQRMRELAVQSSNDTNTGSDRTEIQKEMSQLLEEVDRISSTTEFNTKKLLNGSAGLKISDGTQIGNASSGPNTKQGTYAVSAGATLATSATVTGAAGSTASALAGTTAGTLTVNGVDISVAITDTFEKLAEKINSSVSGVSAGFNAGGLFEIKSTDVGASQKVVIKESAETVVTGLTAATAVTADGTNASNVTLSNSTGGTLTYNGNEVRVNGGAADGLTFNLKDNAAATDIVVNDSLSLHIGANEKQTMSVSINAMDATSLGIKGVDVTSDIGAEAAITTINNAIETVSAERSKLGAYTNRLDHTVNNLGTSSENLTAAESRIRDVDMAKEMMNQTKESILAQASQAMLAQANQKPQAVLQLLQ